jgi:hypothetical protein
VDPSLNEVAKLKNDKQNLVLALLSLSQIAYLDAKRIYAQHTPIPLDEVKIGIDAAFDSNIAMGLDINTRTICDSINEVIDEIQINGGNLPALLGGGALNTLIAPDTTAHPPLNQWHIQ